MHKLNEPILSISAVQAEPSAKPWHVEVGELLARAASHAPLQRLLAGWLPAIEVLPEARRVRWSIDVDPAELF